MPFKILIVDDSALVRRALRLCIETSGDCDVCGEAENGKIAVERVEELHPDIVILDLQMPVMNGLEAAKEISRIAPGSALVMLTMHSYATLADDARAAGIMEVLSKTDAVPNLLLDTIRRLCASASTGFVTQSLTA